MSKREISVEDKLAAIDKILESVTFARSEQLRRLFRWLADRAVDGGPVPSEHEVASLALGRPESFDPQTDSLVRKEMSRLRVKLKEYYTQEGRIDPFRVRADNGYCLAFEPTKPYFAGSAGPNEQPCLMVLPFSASGEAQEFAEAFYDDLLSLFAAMDHLDLISRTTARMYADRSDDVRVFATETGADYLIEGTVRVRDDQTQVVLWLADGRTGKARLLSKVAGSDSEQLSQIVAQGFADRVWLPKSQA